MQTSAHIDLLNDLEKEYIFFCKSVVVNSLNEIDFQRVFRVFQFSLCVPSSVILCYISSLIIEYLLVFEMCFNMTSAKQYKMILDIEREAERETERDREKQRERQRRRQRERGRDRETEREAERERQRDRQRETERETERQRETERE